MVSLASVPLIMMNSSEGGGMPRFYRDLHFTMNDLEQFEWELDGLRAQLTLLPMTGVDESLATTICGPGPDFIVSYAEYSTFREEEGLWSIPPNFVMNVIRYSIDPDQSRARQIRFSQIDILHQVRKKYGAECNLPTNSRRYLFKLIRDTLEQTAKGLIEAGRAKARIERAMRRLSIVGVPKSYST